MVWCSCFESKQVLVHWGIFLDKQYCMNMSCPSSNIVYHCQLYSDLHKQTHYWDPHTLNSQHICAHEKICSLEDKYLSWQMIDLELCSIWDNMQGGWDIAIFTIDFRDGLFMIPCLWIKAHYHLKIRTKWDSNERN